MKCCLGFSTHSPPTLRYRSIGIEIHTAVQLFCYRCDGIKGDCRSEHIVSGRVSNWIRKMDWHTLIQCIIKIAYFLYIHRESNTEYIVVCRAHKAVRARPREWCVLMETKRNFNNNNTKAKKRERKSEHRKNVNKNTTNSIQTHNTLVVAVINNRLTNVYWRMTNTRRFT